MRALFIAAALAASVAGCSDANHVAAQRAQAEPERKLLARHEFKALVLEKNWDGVIAAVGKPDRTSETNGRDTWTYAGRTYDVTTGKPDRAAVVTFQWTVSDGVSFY